MRESWGGKPKGAVKAEVGSIDTRWDPSLSGVGAPPARLVLL